LEALLVGLEKWGMAVPKEQLYRIVHRYAHDGVLDYQSFVRLLNKEAPYGFVFRGRIPCAYQSFIFLEPMVTADWIRTLQ
jgi:hypothetical protein